MQKELGIVVKLNLSLNHQISSRISMIRTNMTLSFVGSMIGRIVKKKSFVLRTWQKNLNKKSITCHLSGTGKGRAALEINLGPSILSFA